MTISKKITLLALCLLFVAASSAALLLPVLANADELGDYGGEEGESYDIWYDNSAGYKIEIYNFYYWEFPIERIQTAVPYSDTEGALSYVNITAYYSVSDEAGGEYVASNYGSATGNTPSVTVTLYSDAIEQQDAIASATIELVPSSDYSELVPGYYAYNVSYDNIEGSDRVDYNSYLSFEISVVTIPGSGSYNDGYQSGYNAGYDAGYASGVSESQEGAYSSGYNAGRLDGYQSGYSDGVLDGNFEVGTTDVPRTIFGVVFDILSTPILGFISVADILVIIFMLGVLFFVLRLIKGG